MATVLWTPAIAPAVGLLIDEPCAEAVTETVLRKTSSALVAEDHREGWTQLIGGLVAVSNTEEKRDYPIAIVIPIDADWSIRIEAAHRMRDALMGRQPRRWFTRQRCHRIANALRTDDARQASATFRDIAIEYFGPERVAAEPWKTSALKAQTARLARYGERLTSTGYRQLLRGRSASRTPFH